MNEDIRRLLEDLRRGNYEDPAEKIALLAAALRENNAEVEFLLSLLKAPQAPVRLAAIEACFGRVEPALHGMLVELSRDRDSRVRAKVAAALGTLTDAKLLELLKTLIEDSESDVRVAALIASTGKPEFIANHCARLKSDRDWRVREVAAKAVAQHKTNDVLKDLFTVFVEDDDDDVITACAEAIEARLAQSETDAESHLPSDTVLLVRAHKQLRDHKTRFPHLFEWVQKRVAMTCDIQALTNFGADLTIEANNGTLSRGHQIAAQCQKLIELIQREPRRSIVLLGESGVGKSSLVGELAYQLAKPANGGWHILRVAPTDFLVNTRFLGEWETRTNELLNAIRKPRRVILYIPNIGDLPAIGRSSRSDSNVATAIAPHIEDGSILVIGESTSEAFERGFSSMPSVQRLFEKVLIAEPSAEATRAILTALRDEAKAPIPEDVLDHLQEVSGYFLSHQRRPGNAAGLMRQVIANWKANGNPITSRDVLTVLSKSTGLPVDLVDDHSPLRIEEVQSFFDQRIIGQPEAVQAVVDLVTLIKAGLTDPNKPFGVFLFVGPTGVGKTELARALAEFIFGDAQRLMRFDMSEFASPEAFQRLIGTRGDGGLLTEAVRQQPFSVVLFDEIEKSHVNVFDLCLQLFDAGRLTDGRGQLVDFRRTIIILTSNIGAESPSRPLGFGGTPAEPDHKPDAERTWRELSRFFRPEFLNRIDRIVNFRPLSLEVAERIARREVELVMKRSGIARRKLVVNLDLSVISLLVREGYSPHFGARPLKRTVERLLLLPLARAIASGRQLEAGVISINAVNNAVSIQVSRPPTPAESAKKKPSALPSWRKQLSDLTGEFNSLQTRIEALAQQKSSLLERTHESGFYQNDFLKSTTFDDIHKIEQFLSLADGLQKSFDGLQARVSGPPIPVTQETALQERVASLAAELAYVSQVAQCREAGDLSDALITLHCVERKGAGQSGVEQLARMYLGFAARRRLTAEVLAERFDVANDCAYLHIAGLGAFGLLRNESGLHRLHHRFRRVDPHSGREKSHEDRETLRVDILPVNAEPDKRFLAGITANTTKLHPERSRLLESANTVVSVFHKPSLRSLEAWTTGPATAAREKAARILFTEINAPTVLPTNADIVRQYELGIGSRIKDHRTGRTTARIAHVLKGHLELLSASDTGLEE